MIGLVDANGDRLTVAYNGLSLNVDSDTVESTTAGAGPSTYTLTQVRSKTAEDYILEPNQQRSGVRVYNSRKAARVITLIGTVYAKSYADLYDRIEDLAVAFDPDTIHWQYGTGSDQLPLTFSTPTLDTANYPTGLMACKYLGIPAAVPEPVITGRQAADFHIDLLLEDPRRYLQAATTMVGPGVTTNKGDFRTWPTFSFTATGAGVANFTITTTSANTSYDPLVLDLRDTVNADAIVVDCANSRITLNGTDAPDIFVSGVYPEFESGSVTVAYSNTTNTTSRSVSYHAAFSL